MLTAGILLLINFKSYDDKEESYRKIPIPISILIGGSLPIEKRLFELLLFLVLMIAGTLLLLNFRSYDDQERGYQKIPPPIPTIPETKPNDPPVNIETTIGIFL